MVNLTYYGPQTGFAPPKKPDSKLQKDGATHLEELRNKQKSEQKQTGQTLTLTESMMISEG